jgi:hypothetical protein
MILRQGSQPNPDSCYFGLSLEKKKKKSYENHEKELYHDSLWRILVSKQAPLKNKPVSATQASLALQYRLCLNSKDIAVLPFHSKLHIRCNKTKFVK